MRAILKKIEEALRIVFLNKRTAKAIIEATELTVKAKESQIELLELYLKEKDFDVKLLKNQIRLMEHTMDSLKAEIRKFKPIDMVYMELDRRGILHSNVTIEETDEQIKVYSIGVTEVETWCRGALHFWVEKPRIMEQRYNYDKQEMENLKVLVS